MAGYEAAGCLDGAIAKTAETIYGRFTKDQAAAARRVLLRMVAPGDGTPDTRRPVEREELGDTGRVVEALTGARLLTLDGDTVEIAHEALLTAWPRLRGWIEEDRERLRVHRNLTEAAHAWQELGREEGALYRGSRLAAAQEHFGGTRREDLTDLEHAYLDAGRDHEQKGRRRSRLVLTAVTAALCLALVAAGLAVGQWQSAVTAQHLAQSRQLAAQSDALLDSDPDLAALLAVRAYRTSPTREATAALYAAAALPLRKRLVGGTEPVDATALSPDGRTVATVSRDGKVRIWELPGGRLRHTFPGHDTGDVAAFSPDGRTLAVATGDVISRWDPVTGKQLGTLALPGGSVRGIAFSPDGRTLAAASRTTVRVWDVTTGRKRRGFTGHLDPEAVAFGPDGRTVAAVGLSGLVRVWDVATGRTRAVGSGRIGGRVVAFSPDGRTYAVIRTGGSVQLREVATGIVRHTFKDAAVGTDGLAFAPDGRTIAIPSPGDTVRLWDTASGAARAIVIAGHHGRGTMKVTLGADGRTLVTSSNRDPAVRIHRLPADLPRTTLPGPDGTSIGDVVFSRDGRTVATVRQGPLGRGAVQLWDAGTGDRETSLALDTDPAPTGKWPPVPVLRLAAVGFDPTGRALAARSVKKGVIEVRDVATGRLRLSRALGVGDTAVFSPDGTRLAVVGRQGAVHLLNLSTGARHTVAQPGNGSLVRKVAFTPDGRTLAAVDIEADGDQVRLLDAATGRTQRTIKPSAQILSAFAFSPDGGTLATVSGSRGSVTMWDARTGRLQDSFRVEGEVASLTFSPDARTLAASGARGVQLWDLATSQNRLTLPTRSPEAVVFSPDGSTLAVGSDGSVGLWSVDLPDPARAIHDICTAVDTDLTSLARSRYLHDQSTETGCRRAAP